MNSNSIVSPMGVACCALLKARNSATPCPMLDATPDATATQRRNGYNARLIETGFSDATTKQRQATPGENITQLRAQFQPLEKSTAAVSNPWKFVALLPANRGAE